MPIYERLSATVSLTLLGLAAYFLIELPARSVELQFLGSPLTVQISQRWLMALLVGGLAATGARAVIYTHPSLPGRASGYVLAFWTTPGLLVILATLWLSLLASTLTGWLVGIAITGLLLWLVILAEYHTVDSRDPRYELARLWLNLVAYALAFGFFVVIYQTRARSILTATEILCVSGLLAASLFRAGPAQMGRSWLFAGLVALVMGQCTWAINLWRIPPLTAGLWLLLVYYLFTGLAQQHLLGRLTRRALVEFAVVAAVGLFVILRYAP
ncbi:MAG: hypothetical protein Kow0063_32120 [Anaerolineae bacterium]